MVDVLEPVRKKVHVDNGHCILLITGEPNSGKSYTGLKIGELLDPDFDIDRVFFSFGKFLEHLSSGKLKEGSALLWDEFGLDASAREHMSKRNVKISKIFQIIRERNLILIMTVPRLSFIDSAPKKLVNIHVEMKGVNRKAKVGYCSWLEWQFNEYKDKMYVHSPVVVQPSGRRYSVRRVGFRIASPNLVAAYEKKARAAKRAFATKLLVEHEREEEEKEQDAVSVEEMVRQVLANPAAFIKTFENGKETITSPSIEAAFNVGGRRACQVRDTVLRKLAGTLKPAKKPTRGNESSNLIDKGLRKTAAVGPASGGEVVSSG